MGRLVHAELKGWPSKPVSIDFSYDGLSRVREDSQTWNGDTQTTSISFKSYPTSIADNRWESYRSLQFPALAGTKKAIKTYFDALDRVSKVQEASTIIASYSYSGKNRLAYRSDGYDHHTYYTYDDARRPSGIHVFDSATSKDRLWESKTQYHNNATKSVIEYRYRPATGDIIQTQGVNKTFDPQGRITESRVSTVFREPENNTPIQFNRRSQKYYNTNGQLDKVIDASFTTGGSKAASFEPSLTGFLGIGGVAGSVWSYLYGKSDWSNLFGNADPYRQIRSEQFGYDSKSGRITTVNSEILKASTLKDLGFNPETAKRNDFENAVYDGKEFAGTQNFQYDKAGNLVEDDRFLYTYDFHSRLTSVADKFPKKDRETIGVLYYYDALGRRVFRKYTAIPQAYLTEYDRKDIRYLYDSKRCIAEIEYPRGYGSPNVLARHIYGSRDQELLRVERRYDDKLTNPMEKYSVHYGFSGGIAFVMDGPNYNMLDLTMRRQYKGSAILGLRTERYVGETKTRFPYLFGTTRYDVFTGMSYHEDTGTYTYDYRSAHKLDYEHYVSENLPEISRKFRDRYGMSRNTELIMTLPVAIPTLAVIVPAAPGLVVDGVTSAGMDFLFTNLSGADQSAGQFLEAFGTGALSGGLGRWATKPVASLALPKLGKQVIEEGIEAVVDTFVDVTVYGEDLSDSVSSNFTFGALDISRTLFNNCFLAGTMIPTVEGLKAIEDIDIGDHVLSMNDQTGEKGYQSVVHLFRNTTNKVVSVTYAPVGKDLPPPPQTGRTERHTQAKKTPTSSDDDDDPPSQNTLVELDAQTVHCTPEHP